MRNIAMILTYEGTAYHGWQVQKNAISVCETMERAATMVLGHKAKNHRLRQNRRRRTRQKLCGKRPHHLAHPCGSAALRHEHPSAP